MERSGGLVGIRAQIVAQSHSELLIDSERLRRIALRGESAHEESVAAFPVRSDTHQVSSRANRRIELERAKPETRLSNALQRPQLDILESATLFVDPGRVFPGKKPAPHDVEGNASGPPYLVPRAPRDCRFRSVDRLERGLDVDPCARKDDPHVTTRLDGVRANRFPELREEGVERRIDQSGRVERPEGVDESRTRENAVPVEREVRECETALAPGELGVDAATRYPHHQPTA